MPPRSLTTKIGWYTLSVIQPLSKKHTFTSLWYDTTMASEIMRPNIGRYVYIAPTAYIGGEVTISDGCTIMHHVVIRGDVSSIHIGRRVNVQDGAIVHTQKGVPLEIADEVTIGHRAVVHCRRVGRQALIGIGAIVLDDAEVGTDSIVAAGALVPPGMIVPDGKLVVGVPARILRDVNADDRRYRDQIIEDYANLGQAHAAGLFPNHNE